MGFPGGASGKEPTCQRRRHKRLGFHPWVVKISWRRAWQPTLVYLRGDSHGQRSLVGYSPWGHKELDMTKTYCYRRDSIILHIAYFQKTTVFRKHLFVTSYSRAGPT